MNRILLALLGSASMTLATPGYSWTRYVANNALDSATCGASKDPCRSIGQATRNSSDGDRIVVRPGEYGNHEVGSPPYAIVVDKELSITSEGGAAVTVINVRDTGRWPVKIFASQVVFGRPGHGFTLIANALFPFSGISVHDGVPNVTVQGNVVIGFERGIDVAGDDGIITHNLATGNDQGFNIHGNRNIAAHNVANGNFAFGGIFIGGTGQIIRQNVCNANTFTGIRVAEGTGHQIKENSTIGNGNEGISLDLNTRAIVTGNNLYGTASNCGFKNNNNAGINATGNYWGAPSGPGPDPADDVCNIGAATTDTSGFLRKEARFPRAPEHGRRWDGDKDRDTDADRDDD